jgi:hypothetical protein
LIAIETLIALGWILNMWVHLLFVMKYWIVSKKVEMVFSQRSNPNLESKVQTITYVLLIWCFITIPSYLFVQYYPSYHGEEILIIDGKPTISKAYGQDLTVLTKITGALVDIPPFIFFYFLANAFYVMRKFRSSYKMGVSQKQIWLQLFSNLFYAVTDPLPTICPQFSKVWCIVTGLAVIANNTSLIILTQTLAELADLQS